MKESEKKKALRQVEKAEAKHHAAESDISKLAQIVQPYFDEEISVCMSSDGATIVNDNGEIGFVKDFIKSIPARK